MLIGFAIFITAVIVSVVVLLIYHYVILGTSNSNYGSTEGPGGYNYDVNIQYLNTLTNSLATAMNTPLFNQLGYADGQSFPDLPDGANRFRINLEKP